MFLKIRRWWHVRVMKRTIIQVWYAEYMYKKGFTISVGKCPARVHAVWDYFVVVSLIEEKPMIYKDALKYVRK